MAGQVSTKHVRVLVLVALLLALVGCGVVVKRAWDDFTYCSEPPSQSERARQQAFVLSHVSDARAFKWETLDCDDEGISTLTFTTALPAARALESFRVDPGCSEAEWPQTVTCSSGAVPVDISLMTTVDRGQPATWSGPTGRDAE